MDGKPAGLNKQSGSIVMEVLVWTLLAFLLALSFERKFIRNYRSFKNAISLQRKPLNL